MSQFGRIVKFNKIFLVFFVLFLGLISSNVSEINSQETLCGYVHDDPGKLVRMELCPLGSDQYIYLWCIPDIYRNRYMKLINPKWGSKGGHTCVLWCEDVEFLSSCDDCGGDGGDLKLEIWTKEGCGSTYKDGDRITIYYKASRDCYAVLYEILPDGREQTLDEGWLQGDQVYSDSETLKEEGKRIFIITAEGEEARCTIYVGREKKTGSLKVYVKDNAGNKLSDASVYVDDDPMGETNSSGYLSISDVPEGYHTVKASKSGYEEDSERVKVEAGETKTVYLTLDKKENGDAPIIEVIWHVSNTYEIGKEGDLYFTVSNKGGDAKGKEEFIIGGYRFTPDNFNLRRGESRITGWKRDFKVLEKYVKNGYVEITFSVEMWNDYGRDTYEETRKVPVKGGVKTGSLKVYVKDNAGNKLSDASVYVDDDPMGETNSSGYLSISDVPEGYHTVEASKSGYEEDSERVKVEAGETKTVYLTLDKEEKTGSLKVYVKDNVGNKLSDASVYVDDNYEGKTNSSGYLSISDVPEGYHTVKASKSGYEEDSERVKVEAGETKTVYLYLDGGNPIQKLWKDLTKKRSGYLKTGSYVFYNDEIAKIYAPILYIEEDALPAPTEKYYRILKSDEEGYVIQYLLKYNSQKTLGVLHAPDWSFVFIHVDINGNIIEIIYDDYLAKHVLHYSKTVEWNKIDDKYKDENHVMLTIDTSWHSMEIGTSGDKLRYYDDYERLYDESLDEAYCSPEYFSDYYSGVKIDSLGFDITNTTNVCAHIEENDIKISNIKVSVLSKDIVIEFISEPGIIVKIWLNDPHSLDPYNVVTGKTGDKYGDYAGYFSISEIQKYSSEIYIVVCKPPKGNGDTVRRGQEDVSVSISNQVFFGLNIGSNYNWPLFNENSALYPIIFLNVVDYPKDLYEKFVLFQFRLN